MWQQVLYEQGTCGAVAQGAQVSKQLSTKSVRTGIQGKLEACSAMQQVSTNDFSI